MNASLFTATIFAKVNGLLFSTELFNDMTPSGDILSIVCDHGKKYQEGFTPIPRHNTGRTSTRKRHEKLTVTNKFNSFGSCIIFGVKTSLKPKKIMLFINGCIQVSGVLNLDFSDAIEPINIVLRYMESLTGGSYTISDIRPELMNFKARCDKKISLEQLISPTSINDFEVTHTDYNPERHTAYLIKVVRNGFKATIKLFESGKINVLGVKSVDMINPLLIGLNTYLRQQNDILYT